MKTMHQPHIAIGIHFSHEYLSKKESFLNHRIFTHIRTTRSRCVVKRFWNFVLMKARLEKVRLSFTLPNTSTIHNLVNLNL
jgi:hypothetical protein